MHEEHGGLGGDSHTHSPAEARNQGSPARLGAGGVPWPRHRQPCYPRGCPYFYALNSPAPLVLSSAIMAANRQHLVAIQADLSWGNSACVIGAEHSSPAHQPSSLAKFTASRRASSRVKMLRKIRKAARINYLVMWSLGQGDHPRVDNAASDPTPSWGRVGYTLHSADDPLGPETALRGN